MQTPISFALEILLDCDTIEKAHKLARKQIKALESQAGKPMHLIPSPTHIAQAPSTQRLLEQHSAAPVAAPVIPRNVGGEINNGDGTKGKRKW